MPHRQSRAQSAAQVRAQAATYIEITSCQRQWDRPPACVLTSLSYPILKLLMPARTARRSFPRSSLHASCGTMHQPFSSRREWTRPSLFLSTIVCHADAWLTKKKSMPRR
eukprot:5416226-Prymnesium_polylepis.2